MKGKRDIGDPLEQTISTGKIGAMKQSANGLDVQKSERSEFQKSENLEFQAANGLASQNVKGHASHPGRTQQTIYLPSDLTKWLRKRAIDEERQISDIVADLVEQYRRSCMNDDV